MLEKNEELWLFKHIFFCKRRATLKQNFLERVSEQQKGRELLKRKSYYA